MIDFANKHEEERWGQLSADTQGEYEKVAAYLRDEYEMSDVSLADVETAVAVGA